MLAAVNAMRPRRPRRSPWRGLPIEVQAIEETQAIAERLKPNTTKVPDVDEIEPLVARAQALASHCEERIAAVKRMLDQQDKGTDV